VGFGRVSSIGGKTPTARSAYRRERDLGTFNKETVGHVRQVRSRGGDDGKGLRLFAAPMSRTIGGGPSGGGKTGSSGGRGAGGQAAGTEAHRKFEHDRRSRRSHFTALASFLGAAETGKERENCIPGMWPQTEWELNPRPQGKGDKKTQNLWYAKCGLWSRHRVGDQRGKKKGGKGTVTGNHGGEMLPDYWGGASGRAIGKNKPVVTSKIRNGVTESF